MVRGVIAAAVGTTAMDLLWYSRYKRSGGQSRFLDWEFSAGLDDWEKASAPGRLGKRIFEAVLQTELDTRWAALTNNIMHWSYGLSWGALFGIIAGSVTRLRIVGGIPFGWTVWGSSYIILPLAGLYKPIWEYDFGTLWQDLSAHLVYGMATAITFRLLLPKSASLVRASQDAND
jgi:hypothetical protein